MEKEKRRFGTVPASVSGGTSIFGFSNARKISRGPGSVAPAPSSRIGSGISSAVILNSNGSDKNLPPIKEDASW